MSTFFALGCGLHKANMSLPPAALRPDLLHLRTPSLQSFESSASESGRSAADHSSAREAARRAVRVAARAGRPGTRLANPNANPAQALSVFRTSLPVARHTVTSVAGMRQ